MPIDSRQVTDLQVSAPSFVLEPAAKGDKVKLSAMYHQDDNAYHLQLTTPEIPEVIIPEPEPVSDPTSTTVKELSYYTPEQIIRQLRAGKAAEYWPVGSTIKFEMEQFRETKNAPTNETKAFYFRSGTVTAVVIGYDHNLNIESPDYNHTMTFMVYPKTGASLSLNINTSSAERYAYCPVLYPVTSVFPDFFDQFYKSMPNDWQQYVIPVIKSYTPYAYNNTAASGSTKVFTFSYDEVFGTTTTLNGTDAQYDYFKIYELSKVSAYTSYAFSSSSNNGFVVASRSTTNSKMTNLKPLTIGTKSMPVVTPLGNSKFSSSITSKEFTSISCDSDYPCIIPCFTIG